MREADFALALLGSGASLPHHRVGLYRNNMQSTLINALRLRYPIVEQLVGEAFFAAMAGNYVADHRPGSALLIQYGADYPEFVESFSPAASLPYLADVARLESAWWRAYHAAEAKALSLAEFATVAADMAGDISVQFHPSFQVVNSDWAIFDIWQSCKHKASLAGVQVDRPQAALVARPEAQVVVTELAVAGFMFATLLQGGIGMASALEQTAAAHPAFDLEWQLGTLIASQSLIGIMGTTTS